MKKKQRNRIAYDQQELTMTHSMSAFCGQYYVSFNMLLLPMSAVCTNALNASIKFVNIKTHCTLSDSF